VVDTIVTRDLVKASTVGCTLFTSASTQRVTPVEKAEVDSRATPPSASKTLSLVRRASNGQPQSVRPMKTAQARGDMSAIMPGGRDIVRVFGQRARVGRQGAPRPAESRSAFRPINSRVLVSRVAVDG
jgi:hypothetical protein